MHLYGGLCWRLHLESTLMNDNLYIHAQYLRPPMAALQDTLSLHFIAPLWLHVPDNTLLYLNAVVLVLRVHDAADN